MFLLYLGLISKTINFASCDSVVVVSKDKESSGIRLLQQRMMTDILPVKGVLKAHWQ